MEINKIYNEDCFETMKRMIDNNLKVDCIITSPPYNMTNRKGGYGDKCNRYDTYNDWIPEKDYIQWTVKGFNMYNKILNDNKVILYNFSYSIENPSLPYKLVNTIIENTEFIIADTIIWRKSTGIPFPANKNRLSRNCEFIFVFTRKNEMNTFDCHKGISNIGKNGQKYYNVFYNVIEAKNNDGSCKLNKATYSTDIVNKLIEIYCDNNYLIYDPFIGTGTTALSSINNYCSFIGSEISKEQCEYANKRIFTKNT